MARRRSVELSSSVVVEFIETYLSVPEGGQVGKPIKLRPWQLEILEAIYDHRTRRAIISFGRKNGKSALTAMLILAHLVGPAARQNSQIYSAALSRDQAAIVFTLAAKMIRMSAELNELIAVRDSKKELYCSLTGVTYRALSADANTAYGLSPVLVIHDELGQVRGPKSELYEALETATAAQSNPLSVIISTQAPSDGDLLSKLIDGAKDKPRTRVFLWTADEELDPFDIETIKQANPAFGDFQNADEVMDMAGEARGMASREASYRNLILNQRVDIRASFVAKSVWKENAGEPEGLDGRGKLYAALDLSETNDLTALVLAAPVKGILNVKPIFWLPADGLVERSRKDRVPYDLWKEQGYLQTTPGRSIQYEFVAEYVARLIETQGVRKIAFDRYNWRHFKPWLLKAGLSESLVDDRFVEFGQGFVSMSPALRTLESLLLDCKIRHGGHPVLSMCMDNAVVETDPAGNRKLTKKKSHGRIDGAVCLAMVASLAAEDMYQSPVFPVSVENITEDLHG
jgi:phage terminase large subunit-like protein